MTPKSERLERERIKRKVFWRDVTTSVAIGSGLVILALGVVFFYVPCLLGPDTCTGPTAESESVATALVVMGPGLFAAGLVGRGVLLWKHRAEFAALQEQTPSTTEALEAKDSWGYESYVLYDEGIARAPTLTGIYMGIWFLGLIIMQVVVFVVGHLTGFAVFPPSGPTTLGNLVFGLQLLIPAIPVGLLEARRRQKGGGRQTIQKAVSSGFAKLTRWEDVTRIELRPIKLGGSRPGYGRWSLVAIVGKKKFNGRRIMILDGERWVEADKIEPIEQFLRHKVGDRLWIFERSGLRTERSR